jgi:hypothetical protein
MRHQHSSASCSSRSRPVGPARRSTAVLPAMQAQHLTKQALQHWLLTQVAGRRPRA